MVEKFLNIFRIPDLRKRVGRGMGSGMGKTSTRGHKGQGSGRYLRTSQACLVFRFRRDRPRDLPNQCMRDRGCLSLNLHRNPKFDLVRLESSLAVFPDTA